MGESKIQTGLRLPEKQYQRVLKKADTLGVSINQLLLVVIDIGLNCLDMELLEQIHAFLHTPQDKP